MKILYFLLVLYLSNSINSLELKCLDSDTHKPEPTSEENLFGQVILFAVFFLNFIYKLIKIIKVQNMEFIKLL